MLNLCSAVWSMKTVKSVVHDNVLSFSQCFSLNESRRERMKYDQSTDSFAFFPFFTQYVDAGWLGRKTKRGVYIYE